MRKINFNNYTSPALSKTTLNAMQDYAEEAINGVSSVITLTSTISANANYTIPLNYHVEANDLVIFHCGEKLVKGTDYNEIGTTGEISNTIQFLHAVGDLDMSGVVGFEDFAETLEFVVRGDYSE